MDAAEALALYREAPTSLLGHLADDDSRPQASGADRHLHHRPQRELHERVRREVRVLCVLPASRITRGLRARVRRTVSQDRRDHCGRRLSSCSCRAVTIPICRSSGTKTCSGRSRQRYPTFKLHALSPPEVIHLSRLSQQPVSAVLDRLIAAGMDSVPGGGRRDSGRPRAQAAALLRQGDRRRVARRHASGARARDCAPRRR